jgi:hypothetical protein
MEIEFLLGTGKMGIIRRSMGKGAFLHGAWGKKQKIFSFGVKTLLNP